MRGVPRRLDSHRLPLQFERKRAFGLKIVKHSAKERRISGVKAQLFTCERKLARLAQAHPLVTMGMARVNAGRFDRGRALRAFAQATFRPDEAKAV